MDDATQGGSTTAELIRMELPVTMAEAPVEDPDTGDVTFVCTALDKNKKPNRRGFRFDWDDPKDVVVKNFLKNPVMPYSHSYGETALPMGRWERVEITAKRVRLWGRIPGGPDYDDIKPIRVRVRDAYIKAVSIGFYLGRTEEVTDKDDTYVLVKGLEIIECSPCLIGAHEGAVIGQDAPDPSAATRFALPARASWCEHELCDTKNGGPVGRLLTLSLPEPKAAPEVLDVPKVAQAAPVAAEGAATEKAATPEPVKDGQPPAPVGYGVAIADALKVIAEFVGKDRPAAAELQDRMAAIEAAITEIKDGLSTDSAHGGPAPEGSTPLASSAVTPAPEQVAPQSREQIVQQAANVAEVLRQAIDRALVGHPGFVLFKEEAAAVHAAEVAARNLAHRKEHGRA